MTAAGVVNFVPNRTKFLPETQRPNCHMTGKTKTEAEAIVSASGWLSQQPEAFRAEVLRRCVLLKFAPDEAIYRVGDELGGIYGLVSGTIATSLAPSTKMPLLVHLGPPGWWIGEGCFISRKPRRIDLHAASETWVLHLPLDAMDEIAAADPAAAMRFANILMMNVEILFQIVHDLQRPEASKRIASVLHRAGWVGDRPIPISQAELGAMANTSRKQVNAAFKYFAAAGWISHTYRSIRITNADALRKYADKNGKS